MKRRLIVLGAIGNCLDIVDAVRAHNRASEKGEFELLGFLDDNAQQQGPGAYGLPVLGPLSAARNFEDAFFLNGIGGPGSFLAKEALLRRLGIGLERFATVIHPSASVSESAQIGQGVAILGNTTICAKVSIDNHVMILPNCVIGHDSSLGDYTILAAGVTVSGSVATGASCYLGSGSAVKHGIRLGERCLLGMGAVLLDDMPDGTVFVGNPARPLGGPRGH